MSKKFWQRGPVSRLFRQRQEALKNTFRKVQGRRSDLETLLRDLPGSLQAWEGGMELLDAHFPIREGQSHIDYLACNSEGELIFVWVRRLCNAETLSKLLPDYDWIQKNQSLWPHLFPPLPQRRSLQMKVWLFALEIDPEVKYLLTYLEGIRLKLFHAKPDSRGSAPSWVLTPWEQWRHTQPPAPRSVLPSSPPVLSVLPTQAPKPKPAKKDPSPMLLSQEELNDLIGVVPGTEFWHQDEVTDPYYDPEAS